MKIKRINYYSFDHKFVYERFNCAKYLGDTTVKGEYLPVAFYHAPKHDVSKGHKEYVMLQMLPKGHPQGYEDRRVAVIRGMTKEEATKYLTKIPGLWCATCDTVIYSTMRHDMTSCNCKDDERVAIDGGREYQKIAYGKGACYMMVHVDLMNSKVKYLKSKKSKKA